MLANAERADSIGVWLLAAVPVVPIARLLSNSDKPNFETKSI